MTIEKAMQLEEINNELATVLLGLVARVTAVREHLKECDHEHVRAAAMLTTFQAEELLQKVSPVFTQSMVVQSIESMADAEAQAEEEARRSHPIIQEELDAHGNWIAANVTGFQSGEQCQNPHCVDGLAPRKTGPDDGDVDMEPCPVCGGPAEGKERMAND